MDQAALDRYVAMELHEIGSGIGAYRTAAATIAWVRLDDTKLRNIGGDGAVVKRVYGANGAPWPRLVVSIWTDLFNATFTLGACRKKAAGDRHWWNTVEIPVSIAGAVPEMFADLEAKIRERSAEKTA